MRRRTVAVLVPIALLVASIAWAQFRRVDSSIEAHLARPDSFDGRFHYCRAVYRPNPRGDGGSWLTDYPLADIDFSIRISELTKIAVSFDQPGQPNHLIVRLTDDELFQCPVIIMQEVGRLFFTAEDAARLRTYLLKGGFLWVDDFWGSYRMGCLGERDPEGVSSERLSDRRSAEQPSALSHDVRSPGRSPDSGNRHLALGPRHVRARLRTAPSCTRARLPTRRDA